MPLFSRQRGRTRRVSLEKVQPSEMILSGNGAPRGRFTFAVLLGMLFAVLLIVAVISGRPPLKYFPGDVARADVHARVGSCWFSVIPALLGPVASGARTA